MKEILINKTFLFKLLKKNRFINSKCFTRNCSNEISKEIEKKYKIILNSPLTDNHVNFFFKQFNIIKSDWKNLKGGQQKKTYLEKLEKKIAQFKLNDEEYQTKIDYIEDQGNSHLKKIVSNQLCFY